MEPIAKSAKDIMNDIHASLRQQGLVRPREGRVLGGVFAGIGRRFGLEPWPARILFTVILLLLPGSQFLLYPLLWVLMPSEDAPTQPPTPPAPVQDQPR
ncbi:MAG TPA: PspC domain-containing protein [Dermatophilaceae bacterium]|nr:PspC domain-containing protein [Dermatophilaceae bacterium]